VITYTLYRVPGAELLPGLDWEPVGDPVGAVDGETLYTLIDPSDLANGEQYTYFAVATYTDGTRSDPSNLVTITAVNDPPSAENDAYATDEDTPLAVAAPGVLGNDDDPDGEDALTATLVTGPQHALSFTLSAGGSFSYTPEANFHGTDTFTYTAGGGGAVSNIATVTLTVNAVNDQPTITDIPDRTISTNGNTGALGFTIADVDGLAGLTVTGSSSNATLVPNANIVFGGSGAARTVTVTAAANQAGTATITVTVTDPGGLSASDSFVLTVRSSYTFVAVKNLPPPRSRAGSTTPLRWKYMEGQTVVDSSGAMPVVEVVGPCPTSGPCNGGTVRTFQDTDPGGSGFRYSGGVWSFNLQTKDSNGKPLPKGDYRLTIRAEGSGFPASPTYPMELK